MTARQVYSRCIAHHTDADQTMDGVKSSPPEPVLPQPASRAVRLLTSSKLWVALLIVGVLGIGISLTMPLLHRLRALQYFDRHADIIQYRLSSEREDWPEQYGEWANALREVKELSIRGATDESLRHVGTMHEVCTLSLQESRRQPITQRGLSCLPPFENLEKLILRGRGFTDEAIADLLRTQPPLETVQLFDTGAARRTLLTLSQIHSVTQLYLMTEVLDDEAFRDLAPIAELDSFAATGAGDQCLRWLSTCPEVHTVGFIYSSLTDEGLRQLRDCQQLRSLSIGGASITDAGLRHFAEAAALEVLILVNCPQLTAAGIAQFPELPHLGSLQLSVNLLSPDSIARMRNLPKLRRLYVYGAIPSELRPLLDEQWTVHELQPYPEEESWDLMRQEDMEW